MKRGGGGEWDNPKSSVSASLDARGPLSVCVGLAIVFAGLVANSRGKEVGRSGGVYRFDTIRVDGWPWVYLHRATEFDNGVSRHRPIDISVRDVYGSFDYSRLYLFYVYADAAIWLVAALLLSLSISFIPCFFPRRRTL